MAANFRLLSHFGYSNIVTKSILGCEGIVTEGIVTALCATKKVNKFCDKI